MWPRLAGPALPSYQTAADVLEKKNGSGIRLVGWTLVRTVLIAPPLMVVGIGWKKALAGSLLASSLISLFTLVRIWSAGPLAVPECQLPAPTPAPPPSGMGYWYGF